MSYQKLPKIPCLYLITAPHVDDLSSLVSRAILGGVSLVQLRDKECSDKQLLDLGRSLLPVLRAHRTPLIINDRISVARSLGVGVHLGRTDGDPHFARKQLGKDAIIGLTIHRDLSLARKYAGVVDYVGVGPVFPTRTKKDASSTLGLGALAEICSMSPLPVIAIGGIDAKNASSVWNCSPAGVAVCSAICDSDSPGHAAKMIGRFD